MIIASTLFTLDWGSALPHVAALVIATLAVGWGAARAFRYE